MLNPFDAPVMMQGIFHPGFMDIHQQAAILLGERNMVVFRGEGGEIERRPSKPTETRTVSNGEAGSRDWPPLLDDAVQPSDPEMVIDRLTELWRGETSNRYAEAAITGTVAIALASCRDYGDVAAAQLAAEDLWHGRDKSRLGIAA